MSALDLDALRCEVEALQAERDTARLEAGRLRARLRTGGAVSTDLRTLAQAVVDADTAWQWSDCCEPAEIEEIRYTLDSAFLALTEALAPIPGDRSRGSAAILAALDAADAQGYARAMGDVVERADHSADYTGWSDYALGHRDAHERLAVWARERLPAAAEKEHGG